MPTITLKKTVVEAILGKKLSEEELKDRISMLGTDLEGIKGEDIEVEIFPNRPDLLSEQGFARALSAFVGEKTGLPEYEVKKSDAKVIVDKNVTMRPYTVCAIVKNLSFDNNAIKELMNLQEKLSTTHGRRRKKSEYGVYPLKNIAFPLTYIAKDPKDVTFWPLGMKGPIRADKVEEEHPKGKAFKHVAKDWKTYPFFIDANDNVMCMLPYTNSHDTGKVDTATTEVFVECSGTDLENVQVALNILTTTLADMGGDVYSVTVEYPDETLVTPDLSSKKMKADLDYINKRLGLTLKEKELGTLLAKMNVGYEKGTALVPAYRADIIHPVDVAEDVAIAYGYENFEEEIPEVATIAAESEEAKQKRLLASLLTGLQFQEVEPYNLSNEERENTSLQQDIPLVRLKNAVNEDYNVLRASLFSSLLGVFVTNKSKEYPQRIFTIGKTFHPAKTQTGVEEKIKLGIALIGEVGYTDARQVLEYLGRVLDWKIEVKEKDAAMFLPGRSAEILVDGKAVGMMGEASPEVLMAWELEYPVVMLEMEVR